MEIKPLYKTILPVRIIKHRPKKAIEFIAPVKKIKQLAEQLRGVEKLNKIRKPKEKRAKQNKAEKKLARLDKNQGKLLHQLVLIQERIERMEKEKERYCLVDWNKLEDDKLYIFSIIKEDEAGVVKIDVKEDYTTECHCMDWKIRCRGQMIPCKHIYYLLNKILGYELFDYYDNQIMLPNIFEELVRGRLEAKRRNLDNIENMAEDRECPICFSTFEDYDRGLIKRCPGCHCCSHDDCAKMWHLHSVTKTCPICKSAHWKNIVK